MNDVDIILDKCFVVISLVPLISNKIKPNLQKKTKIPCFNIFFMLWICEPSKNIVSLNYEIVIQSKCNNKINDLTIKKGYDINIIEFMICSYN
jgi:hypothetical protein